MIFKQGFRSKMHITAFNIVVDWSNSGFGLVILYSQVNNDIVVLSDQKEFNQENCPTTTEIKKQRHP